MQECTNVFVMQQSHYAMSVVGGPLNERATDLRPCRVGAYQETSGNEQKVRSVVGFLTHGLLPE